MEHLIPDHWFVDLHWPILLLSTALSIVVLGKGADWLVESASGVAYRFGIPKIIGRVWTASSEYRGCSKIKWNLLIQKETLTRTFRREIMEGAINSLKAMRFTRIHHSVI